jgi:hypothetical protein
MTVARLADLDIAGWQSVLDRHAAIFSGIVPGSKVGLLPKDDFDSPTATMVVWETTEAGISARYQHFPGFEDVQIDLLFIADDATIARLHDPKNPHPFGDIKSKVRRRDILLYVVKPRHELIDNGYEEFLDSLGLVFMGACR